MSMPKGNIHWKQIPANACVEDRRKYYVAHVGGEEKVVNWGSQDAHEAQASLWARAQSGKNARTCGDLFRKTRPLPGLRGARRRRSRR